MEHRALTTHVIVHNSLTQNWNKISDLRFLRDIYILMTKKDDAKIRE